MSRKYGCKYVLFRCSLYYIKSISMMVMWNCLRFRSYNYFLYVVYSDCLVNV